MTCVRSKSGAIYPFAYRVSSRLRLLFFERTRAPYKSRSGNGRIGVTLSAVIGQKFVAFTQNRLSIRHGSGQQWISVSAFCRLPAHPSTALPLVGCCCYRYL